MESELIKVKVRKATIEDFIWLDWEQNKKIKIGYPFYIKIGDELHFRFVKLLKGAEKKAQWEAIKWKIKEDLIYVLDPIFSGTDRVIIKKEQ